MYFFMVVHIAACLTLIKAFSNLRRHGKGLAGVVMSWGKMSSDCNSMASRTVGDHRK